MPEVELWPVLLAVLAKVQDDRSWLVYDTCITELWAVRGHDFSLSKSARLW